MKWALDTLYNMDAGEFVRGLDDASVDLVITSPPYNLRNSTGNGIKAPTGGRWENAALAIGYSDHTDDMPHELYVTWQREIVAELWRALKPTGAIFYNHKWRVQDGDLQRLPEQIVAGIPIRQIIIWHRKGGMNFNNGYFLPTFELVYVLAKPEFRLKDGANAYTDVWEINAEKSTPHPAPFPYELPRRIIDSVEGEVVVDPFAGWGTTLLAARNLGRSYIGSELGAEYCQLAEARLAKPFNVGLFGEVN